MPMGCVLDRLNGGYGAGSGMAGHGPDIRDSRQNIGHTFQLGLSSTTTSTLILPAFAKMSVM